MFLKRKNKDLVADNFSKVQQLTASPKIKSATSVCVGEKLEGRDEWEGAVKQGSLLFGATYST